MKNILPILFFFSLGISYAQERRLVWAEEFEGNKLNENDWNFELGDGCPYICGWGNKEKQIYVVEGPIDSLFLDNCIAVAGSDFNDIPPCEAVIIMDNERRNKEVVRTMEKLIAEDYSIVIWPDTITHKDINDCVLAGVDVKTILENNTHQGLSAMMAIATWKKT